MKRSQTYNPIWIENTIWYINTDNNNTPSTPRQKERIENTVCSCSICIANSSGVIFGIFFSCWPITIIATKATWTSNVCARKMRAKGEKPESMLEKKKNDSNNNNNKTKHITQHNAMSLSLTQKRIQKKIQRSLKSAFWNSLKNDDDDEATTSRSTQVLYRDYTISMLGKFIWVVERVK